MLVTFNSRHVEAMGGTGIGRWSGKIVVGKMRVERRKRECRYRAKEASIIE